VLLISLGNAVYFYLLSLLVTFYSQKKPVDWWENQHTVWGEIRDDKSMKVVESTYDLPAHMSSMRMLDQEIEFSLKLF